MRTLTTLVLIGIFTSACTDARLSTDRRSEEQKQKVQQEHKKEMKQATEAYRSMKISDMAGQKQEDKKSDQSAEESQNDSKNQHSPSDQKRQP